MRWSLARASVAHGHGNSDSGQSHLNWSVLFGDQGAMTVAIQADRDGSYARLVPMGSFDLAHTIAAARAVEDTEPLLAKCSSVDVDLTQLDRVDGAGAALLARLLDRLDTHGRHPNLIEGANHEAARLIARYRERRVSVPTPDVHPMSPLMRIGALASQLPGKANEAFDFTGRCAIALPKAAAATSSVDWRSLPKLIQEIGADGMPVACSANLLIGFIIGFLGVGQLARFGAVAYVPQLVAVVQFRELGPLITAIVVAARTGAGIASEIATMKVSEEIDALRSMGFDPVRWLVVPRCLALALTLPLLTWVGDLLALVGGLVATTVTTDMTARTYVQATFNAITGNDFLAGLIKSPFLGLAIGLIACGQGLLASGGAAAVGARTTHAVVLAIFSVIMINTVFTFLFVLIGI